jgi:hypothetical protein
MRILRFLQITGVLLISAGVCVNTALAQEARRVGVTGAYPGSVGLFWQISDRFAFRPDVTFTQSSGDTTTTVTAGQNAIGTSRSSNDTWNVTLGASALFYLHDWDALRAYVSPRLAYVRGAINTTTTMTVPASVAADQTTTSGYLASGSFGAQYALGKRLAIFGEVGLSYTDTTTKTAPSFSASSRTLNSRSGIGAMFMF